MESKPNKRPRRSRAADTSRKKGGVPASAAPALSAAIKLADLVESDYKLLTILSRLGIKLGFAESSVADICARYRLSADLFLLICRIYSSDDFRPQPEYLEPSDLGNLVSYLRTSHTYYLTTVIPRLGGDIQRMTACCDEKYGKILNSFFDNYRREVDKHFAYEERVVFPYIEALLAGKRDTDPTGYSIETFEENHSDIDTTLNDLKNIILKYIPEDCPPMMQTDVLLEIFRFEEDLAKHTVIENEVLIPLVTKLESHE